MFMIAKWRQVRYNYHRTYEGNDDGEDKKLGSLLETE